MQKKGKKRRGQREDNHHKISKLECSNIELAIMDCYGIEHDQNTIKKAGIFAAKNNISDYSKYV